MCQCTLLKSAKTRGLKVCPLSKDPVVEQTSVYYTVDRILKEGSTWQNSRGLFKSDWDTGEWEKAESQRMKQEVSKESEKDF